MSVEAIRERHLERMRVYGGVRNAADADVEELLQEIDRLNTAAMDLAEAARISLQQEGWHTDERLARALDALYGQR
jgi:hypothetical protein